MSSIAVDGYQASAVFEKIRVGHAALSSKDRQEMVKKVKGLFQLDVKNSAGKVQSWTIDMKSGEGSVSLGASKTKPDIIINVADQDFVAMSEGKLNGQKAFMQGKLKVKGNIMLATKLDTVLKASQPTAKL